VLASPATASNANQRNEATNPRCEVKLMPHPALRAYLRRPNDFC
jgi:hypothetical protein